MPRELVPGAESSRLEVRDGLVYKFLGQERALKQVRKMVMRAAESLRWPDHFNPQRYDPELHAIISPLVEGPEATPDECLLLVQHLRATGREHIGDIRPSNVIRACRGLVVVDFTLREPYATAAGLHERYAHLAPMWEGLPGPPEAVEVDFNLKAEELWRAPQARPVSPQALWVMATLEDGD